MKFGGRIKSAFASKKRLVKMALIVAFLPIGIAIPLLSFESYNGTQTSAQTSTTEAARQERIEEYKKNLREELATERRQAITDNCVASQERLTTFATNIERIKNARKTRY